MNNQNLYNHLKLHFVVFILGFTAILGKLISISAIYIVWYRVLIASLAFIVILHVKKISWIIPLKEMLEIILVGFIVAAHWLLFFGAIKLSNVSVTLGCLASTTLFTSLIEPFYFKTRIKIKEVFIGIVIILGLYLIFQFETRYWKGILAAIVSAILAGWFTVYNKKLVAKHRARVISFYEMLGAFFGITIYLTFSGGLTTPKILPEYTDIIYLIILGIVCTAFAFTLQVDIMKKLSAFIVSLTINLEPLYGIVLAFILFNEYQFLSTGFYFGAGIILFSVLGYPILQYFGKSRINKEDI